MTDAAVSCLDLLLRWAVLRLCDANTQCLLKVLELCKAMFAVCQEMVSALPLAHTYRLYRTDALPCLTQASLLPVPARFGKDVYSIESNAVYSIAGLPSD